MAPPPGTADSAPGPRADFDPLVLNRLRAELDQVEAILHRSAGQQEALEVTRDVRSELRQDAPNQLKIRALLGVLAQALRSRD